MILEQDWKFLNSNEHGRRVEIDNVIGYVGTQRFWDEFILPSFAKLFPKANYNLSLDRIEYVTLPQLKILTELSQKKGISAAIDAVQNVQSEYSNYDISSQGFIPDITAEEQKIEKRVMKKELEDNDIHWLSEKLESLNKDFSRRTGIRSLENMEQKVNVNGEDTDNLNDDMGYDDMGYDDIGDVNS